jgi:4-hydroxybenzoate polyprenyltransferase
MNTSDIFNLLRVNQWYKNLVIFVPIIFARELFDISGILKTFIGFTSLCFISSSYYIINDIFDRKHDRLHPEKKNRPISASKLSVYSALIISLLLIILSLLLALALSNLFAYSVSFLFISSLLYTLWIKNEVFLDIIVIATNFVIRTISGTLVILENGKPWLRISPWLIMGIFFLSLFLSSGKRKADFDLLKTKASKFKFVLGQYNRDLTRMLMIVSTTLLIISYSLYSFLSIYPLLLLTLPVAIYTILRYFYLVEKNSPIARHPEMFYKDRKLILGIVFLFLFVLVIIYSTNI